MMNRTLLLISTCLLSVGYSQSKKFDFKLGQEYDLPRKTEDLAFIGNKADGIVNLSIKKDELIMVRFDATKLKKTLEQKIDLDATRNFNSEIVADFSNGNYFWIHSDWERSSGSELLLYDKINVQTGKMSEVNRQMFQTTKIAAPNVEPTGMYTKISIHKYDFNFDSQKKVLCVSYRLKPEFKSDKKNFDKMGFQVFDDNMNKLWGNEFTMPYTEKVMDNSDFSVDANGNAYMLAKVYDNEKRIEKDKVTGLPGFHFEVFKFSKDSKTPTVVPVAVGENFIRQPSITESSKGDMIIACTYSKKAKGTGTDGIFLATIDKDNKLVKFKNGFYEFPKSELTKYVGAKEKKRIEDKDDYEALNLVVHDVIIEKDGSVLIACEDYQLVSNTYSTTNGSMRTTTTFVYNDILVAKVNADGEFAWLRKIPKRQKGMRGRGTMGFKLINDETGYYFLYLDHLKNLNITEDQAPAYHSDGKGGQVVVTKVDMKGEMTKELLFDTREEDIMIYPADFYRIDGNRFIGRAKIKKTLFQPLLITSK